MTDGVFCVWLLLADFPFLWGSPGSRHAGVAHSFLLHSSMWTQARGWPTRQLTDILDASSLWRFCIKLYKHSHKALVGKYVLFLLVTKWLHVWHLRDSSDVCQTNSLYFPSHGESSSCPHMWHNLPLFINFLALFILNQLYTYRKGQIQDKIWYILCPVAFIIFLH